MDIEKLLKLLKENNVKYVIIGATAFPYYGYMRATMDVDIFIEPTGLPKVPSVHKFTTASLISLYLSF
ncbi:hypothetical protein DRQ23_07575 [bacterium]|nr:MAG: hypothetical protein DRQ23_07575 [bacterium]